VRREPDVLLRRDAVDLPFVEPLRLELDRAPPAEPFLLFDLVELERLRVDRLLEDRVVWAMGLSPHLAFLASCAFRTGGSIWTYPLSSGFERPVA
jgi:hypothetical protein